MTTQLPFDGGPSPVPPDKPQRGDRVYVKDDADVGDDIGEIIGQKLIGVVTWYWVAFRDEDGFIYHIGDYLPEMMEYAGS